MKRRWVFGTCAVLLLTLCTSPLASAQEAETEVTDWGDESGGEGADDDWGGGGWDSLETEEVELQEHPIEAFYTWASESLQGYLSYKGLYFRRTRDELGRPQRSNRNEGELRLEYKRTLFGPLSLYAQIDTRIDDDNYHDEFFQDYDNNDDLRPVVSYNDLHVLLTEGGLDLRLGYQTVAWGSGDLANPVDTVNPIDLSDLYQSQKMGILLARANYYIADFNFEVLYSPFHTVNRLPAEGKRFSAAAPPLPALPGLDVSFATDRKIPEFPNGSQAAGRVSRSFGGWDLAGSVYYGRNHLPAVRLLANEGVPAGVGAPIPVSVTTELSYEEILVYGFDFATTLGWLAPDSEVGDLIKKMQIHGEIAYWDTLPSSFDDYLRYVAGLNYTFNNV
ncbi:MAG: DUF1302 family protein, partial [Planctomycetota bacterium]